MTTAGLRRAGAILLISGCQAMAQTAWLPTPGRLTVTGLYIYQNSHRTYIGNRLGYLNDRVQRTGAVALEYGLSERFALDLSTGYGHNGIRNLTTRAEDSGVLDTNFGFRWRLVDERRHTYAPTFAIRAGGTVRGTYTPNRTHSVGDGASGAELSFMLGKTYHDGRTGWWADSGLRKRSSGVPDDYFGFAGVYRSFLGVAWSAGFRQSRALGGQTLGRFGYRPQWLKEVSQGLELGAGRSDRRGRFYQLFVARQLAGSRNTPDNLVMGVAVTFSVRPARMFGLGTP